MGTPPLTDTGNDYLTAEDLIESASLSLAGLLESEGVADVTVRVGTEDDFAIAIVPKRADAAPIEIHNDQHGTFLFAGKNIEEDLEDTELYANGRWAFALSLSRAIMNYGIIETDEMAADELLAWSYEIVTPTGVYRSERDMRGLLRLRNRRGEKQTIRFAPYTSLGDAGQ